MYQKVLVPLDGSELAECALSHVIQLVKDGAAQDVIILNVIVVHIPGRGDYSGLTEINTVRENLFAESGKYLADVESRFASEGIKVTKVSLEANLPADAISDYAQENGVELIVIATHGYTGMKKLMFGSVALRVLHDTHVPVLLIRPESCR